VSDLGILNRPDISYYRSNREVGLSRQLQQWTRVDRGAADDLISCQTPAGEMFHV